MSLPTGWVVGEEYARLRGILYAEVQTTSSHLHCYNPCLIHCHHLPSHCNSLLAPCFCPCLHVVCFIPVPRVVLSRCKSHQITLYGIPFHSEERQSPCSIQDLSLPFSLTFVTSSAITLPFAASALVTATLL